MFGVAPRVENLGQQAVARNVSPSGSCIFCRIIAGQSPGNFVFRDQAVVAIVDLRQVTEGHVLVMPRAHLETIDELDEATAAKLAWTTVRVSRAVRRAYAPDGINVWQANGEAAGQEVPHVHIHVFPRSAGDGLMRVYPGVPLERYEADSEVLARVARRVSQALV
jgi:histidine triad (HIT) family protein